MHYPPSVNVWLAIAVGGALGTLARVGLHPGWFNGGAPELWGTLVVNVAGASLLGAVTGHGLPRLKPALRAAITTGFLGSFTTFSGILTIWLGLTVVDQPALGVVYLLATGLGGIVSAYGGIEAGQWWRAVGALRGGSDD